MATTIKAALRKWEEASGQKAAEAKEIKCNHGQLDISNYLVSGYLASKKSLDIHVSGYPIIQISNYLDITSLTATKVHAQYPPIKNLDGPFHNLVMCEKMSLSSNQITVIANLSAFKKLKAQYIYQGSKTSATFQLWYIQFLPGWSGVQKLRVPCMVLCPKSK